MSTEKSMTLPAIIHIDKLQQIAEQIFDQIESSTRDLHMLRGAIDQMSYMTRNSNNQLNDFLLEGMVSLNKQLSQIHKQHLLQLKGLRTQANNLTIQYENIQNDVKNQLQHQQVVEAKVGFHF